MDSIKVRENLRVMSRNMNPKRSDTVEDMCSCTEPLPVLKNGRTGFYAVCKNCEKRHRP